METKEERDALMWTVYKKDDMGGFGLLALQNRLTFLKIPYRSEKLSENAALEATLIYVPRAYVEQAKRVASGE